ncbi:hypothetical protein [Lysobacter sp. yr284]|uniref:hypothetical protein n=1 Tax=Lysobacter sp. yr284 TaxID=1761791 RepID=UPI001113C01F|nr:hypothetical protein [Lysobacter sp. yr284]
MERSSCGSRRCALALAISLLLAAPLAQAQNFEAYYGDPEPADSGWDVKATRACGPGSITVGTRQAGDTQLAQLSRADDNGNLIWQAAYYIGGSKRSRGEAVIELSSGRGFAITGAVQYGGSTDRIYVLQVDCEGRPAWTSVLGNRVEGQNAVGLDLIESAPDRGETLYLVGEEISRDARRKFGRIARLDAGGGLLWNQFYDGGSRWPEVRLRALAQNVAATGLADDLVVAGNTTNGAGLMGALLLRTDISGTPVCASTLNNADKQHALFHGITALRAPGYFGQSALVGLQSNPADGATQVYLARFEPVGCKVLAQAFWSDPKTTSIRAYDVVEALDRSSDDSILAIAATRGVPEFGAALGARTSSLLPATGSMNYFGAGREMLVSIDLKAPDRLLLAGSTFIDRDAGADPQDVYLVQTDPAGATTCAIPWQPKAQRVAYPPQNVSLKPILIDAYERVGTEPVGTGGQGYACKPDPKRLAGAAAPACARAPAAKKTAS